MLRYKESPAGCVIYFMLSIVINFLIFILRISAHELPHHNATMITMATTNHHHHRTHHAMDQLSTVAITDTDKTTASLSDNVNETSKCIFSLYLYVSRKSRNQSRNFAFVFVPDK